MDERRFFFSLPSAELSSTLNRLVLGLDHYGKPSIQLSRNIADIPPARLVASDARLRRSPPPPLPFPLARALVGDGDGQRCMPISY